MPHLVEPCYHLTDCSWYCGPEEAIAEAAWRPVAQYFGAAPGYKKRIEGITIHRKNSPDFVILFKGKDPDLLVFSEEVFQKFVYDGVAKHQGEPKAKALQAKLAKKPPL